MIDRRIPPAGDLFTAKPSFATSDRERLARLEERLAHELMDTEQRGELEDQVRGLRRRLASEGCAAELGAL